MATTKNANTKNTQSGNTKNYRSFDLLLSMGKAAFCECILQEEEIKAAFKEASKEDKLGTNSMKRISKGQKRKRLMRNLKNSLKREPCVLVRSRSK